ncbi:hypothetical protein NDU88_006709, partial [Pleurodeles waltl]
LTSTKIGQLDVGAVGVTLVHHQCRWIHACRLERGPKPPVITAVRCLLKQGSDSVNPQEIPSVLVVQAED